MKMKGSFKLDKIVIANIQSLFNVRFPFKIMKIMRYVNSKINDRFGRVYGKSPNNKTESVFLPKIINWILSKLYVIWLSIAH